MGTTLVRKFYIAVQLLSICVLVYFYHGIHIYPCEHDLWQNAVGEVPRTPVLFVPISGHVNVSLSAVFDSIIF